MIGYQYTIMVENDFFKNIFFNLAKGVWTLHYKGKLDHQYGRSVRKLHNCLNPS